MMDLQEEAVTGPKKVPYRATYSNISPSILGQVEFLGPTMGAEQGILIVIVGRAVLGNACQMGRWRGPG